MLDSPKAPFITHTLAAHRHLIAELIPHTIHHRDDLAAHKIKIDGEDIPYHPLHHGEVRRQ